MSTVSFDFQFEIGDTVRHAATPPGGNYNGLQRLYIVERIVQQCHGGVQGHYRVRVIGDDGAFSTVLELSAPEVAAYPTDEELADLKAERKVREAEREGMLRLRREAARASQAAS